MSKSPYQDNSFLIKKISAAHGLSTELIMIFKAFVSDVESPINPVEEGENLSMIETLKDLVDFYNYPKDDYDRILLAYEDFYNLKRAAVALDDRITEGDSRAIISALDNLNLEAIPDQDVLTEEKKVELDTLVESIQKQYEYIYANYTPNA